MNEAAMDPGSNMLYVDFPNFSSHLLESLNQQRLEGKFCDISIHVQGKVFKAHRAVLAASSPYFHDQVLFRNTSRLVLPGVMDARAFEGILASCYAGRLAVPSADIVSYLTVGSFLQMWHVVDKCTELLRECQAPAPSGQRPCRVTDNQSPSSSSNNYFSPREARPEAGEVTPAKADPREEGEDDDDEDEEEEEEVVEEDEEDEDEEVEDGDQEAAKAKEVEQKVTSNQGGPGSGEVSAGGLPDSPWPQPACVQPGIVPHKRWVHVKKEKPDEGDLVLTCEEDEQHFVKAPGRRRSEPQLLSISDVCTLAGPELLGAEEPAFDEQIDYCGSSEDLAYEPLDEGAPRAYPGQAPGGQLSTYHPRGDTHHGAVQAAAGSPGPGAKLFACHCGKSFTHKSQRDRHINMHLNLRPFGCTICNKKFKMKHHLVEHMKIHTGLKPFECHVCSKKFMWRDSFLRHKAACEKLQRATTANPDIN
ncbi:zinc finger and BTB domain-containing protein 22-like [Stegostoma tigrinum]|uniref:zinc finger and BTB domain-containing protein 22-like n=1 Tax=Stegostoma tigrinum TaxID=3053191 RepID=UPI00202B00EB|nr:zinc finger and BTB domain-containing protein 22-like [Stegostoma tigrinum]XP_059495406.1 zinc finger and BTB domain-containing protein 22-like [Stegostoma tigrinum]